MAARSTQSHAISCNTMTFYRFRDNSVHTLISFYTTLYTPMWFYTTWKQPVPVWHPNSIQFLTWTHNPIRLCNNRYTPIRSYKYKKSIRLDTFLEPYTHLCAGEKSSAQFYTYEWFLHPKWNLARPKHVQTHAILNKPSQSSIIFTFLYDQTTKYNLDNPARNYANMRDPTQSDTGRRNLSTKYAWYNV